MNKIPNYIKKKIEQTEGAERIVTALLLKKKIIIFFQRFTYSLIILDHPIQLIFFSVNLLKKSLFVVSFSKINIIKTKIFKPSLLFI